MTRHLSISRPRPVKGPRELAVSFALRLLMWFDEQFQRGWELDELAPLSAEEEKCLTEGHELIRRLARSRHLVAEDRP